MLGPVIILCGVIVTGIEFALKNKKKVTTKPSEQPSTDPAPAVESKPKETPAAE